MLAGSQLAFSFIFQSVTSAHGMVPATFRVFPPQPNLGMPSQTCPKTYSSDMLRYKLQTLRESDFTQPLKLGMEREDRICRP